MAPASPTIDTGARLRAEPAAGGEAARFAETPAPARFYQASRAGGPAFPWILCLLLLPGILFRPNPVQGATVPVRFPEGIVRGFLLLTDTGGRRIASGDFLQVGRGGEVKSRVLLRFKDGSVHDETAVFTQQRIFVLKSYHLVQRGAAFREEMEANLDRRSGGYLVSVKPRGEGREKVLKGKLDLPQDVYNGMVPIVAKNLGGARGSIRLVAFTPAPRVIELDMIPSGKDGYLIGDLEKSAVHYVLKPKLGMLRLPATLLGRLPPDNHLWITTADVPAFVRFQGPLASRGPIWRIELTSPVWPRQ